MVNKKSKRNNNTTSKKPAPSEGKLITNSDKLIKSISSKTPYYGSKPDKRFKKLGLEYIRSLLTQVELT
jgi:hypothetical protein